MVVFRQKTIFLAILHRIDRWTDQQMDQQTDGGTDELTKNGRTEGRTDQRMDGPKDGGTDRWRDRPTDGPTYEPTYGPTDGPTDGPTSALHPTQFALSATSAKPPRLTMGQNRKKHRLNSHLIIHCPTTKGVSEVIAVEGASEAKRAVRSKQTSERCERTSERTGEWPSSLVCIFGCSGPQCSLTTRQKKIEVDKKK